jgi:hypothetical protein
MGKNDIEGGTDFVTSEFEISVGVGTAHKTDLVATRAEVNSIL